MLAKIAIFAASASTNEVAVTVRATAHPGFDLVAPYLDAKGTPPIGVDFGLVVETAGPFDVRLGLGVEGWHRNWTVGATTESFRLYPTLFRVEPRVAARVPIHSTEHAQYTVDVGAGLGAGFANAVSPTVSVRPAITLGAGRTKILVAFDGRLGLKRSMTNYHACPPTGQLAGCGPGEQIDVGGTSAGVVFGLSRDRRPTERIVNAQVWTQPFTHATDPKYAMTVPVGAEIGIVRKAVERARTLPATHPRSPTLSRYVGFATGGAVEQDSVHTNHHVQQIDQAFVLRLEPRIAARVDLHWFDKAFGTPPDISVDVGVGFATCRVANEYFCPLTFAPFSRTTVVFGDGRLRALVGAEVYHHLASFEFLGRFQPAPTSGPQSPRIVFSVGVAW